MSKSKKSNKRVSKSKKVDHANEQEQEKVQLKDGLEDTEQQHRFFFSFLKMDHKTMQITSKKVLYPPLTHLQGGQQSSSSLTSDQELDVTVFGMHLIGQMIPSKMATSLFLQTVVSSALKLEAYFRATFKLDIDIDLQTTFISYSSSMEQLMADSNMNIASGQALLMDRVVGGSGIDFLRTSSYHIQDDYAARMYKPDGTRLNPPVSSNKSTTNDEEFLSYRRCINVLNPNTSKWYFAPKGISALLHYESTIIPFIRPTSELYKKRMESYHFCKDIPRDIPLPTLIHSVADGIRATRELIVSKLGGDRHAGVTKTPLFTHKQDRKNTLFEQVPSSQPPSPSPSRNGSPPTMSIRDEVMQELLQEECESANILLEHIRVVASGQQQHKKDTATAPLKTTNATKKRYEMVVPVRLLHVESVAQVRDMCARCEHDKHMIYKMLCAMHLTCSQFSAVCGVAIGDKFVSSHFYWYQGTEQEAMQLLVDAFKYCTTNGICDQMLYDYLQERK